MWPHQVANDKPQGKWLLYMDEPPIIEGAGGGECYVNQQKLINPLLLQKRPATPDQIAQLLQEQPRFYSGNKTKVSFSESSIYEKTTNTKFSSISSSLNRVKRDRAMIIRAERLTDKDGKKTDTVHMVSFFFQP
jgi:integrin alpha 7